MNNNMYIVDRFDEHLCCSIERAKRSIKKILLHSSSTMRRSPKFNRICSNFNKQDANTQSNYNANARNKSDPGLNSENYQKK